MKEEIQRELEGTGSEGGSERERAKKEVWRRRLTERPCGDRCVCVYGCVCAYGYVCGVAPRFSSSASRCEGTDHKSPIGGCCK